jgi:chromosome segregation ATPase
MSMKDAYIEKLQAQLDEWNAEVDKLKARVDSASADAKIDYYEQIDKLRKEQLEAQKKLIELQGASETAWEDVKAGVESAWDSLESAIKKAASRFE